MANNGSSREPSSAAPEPDRWYNLTLGSSFKSQGHPSSSKFFTLRCEFPPPFLKLFPRVKLSLSNVPPMLGLTLLQRSSGNFSLSRPLLGFWWFLMLDEFKPASIDKNQAGSLHKNKDNRVTVEFPNNQPGKPKVTFEGSTEDYKDNDGVLFFDGETFRLERLHRAVKRLRHVRLPGESASAAVAAAAAAAAAPGPAVESRSPPLGKPKSQPTNKPMPHSVPVEIERIDIGEPENPGPKTNSRSNDFLSVPPNQSPFSPDQKNYDLEENLDIVVDDDDGETPNKSNAALQETNTGFDINNIPNLNDTDDEIADVDVSDDEADKGPNAAEALRAQVNAEEKDGQTSSSSESSGSGSSGSGSGSGSSSSDSDGSDDDSASSAQKTHSKKDERSFSFIQIDWRGSGVKFCAGGSVVLY
ncbi:hypothetical protein ACLOJK_002177 [Asimina triloba]